MQFSKGLLTIWDTDIEPKFDESVMSYLVYQHEICPTTNKEHIQGYFELINKPRIRKRHQYFYDWFIPHVKKEDQSKTLWIKKVDTNNGADEYCKKSETSIEGTMREFGKMREVKKQMTNEELIKSIEECRNIGEVMRLPGVKNCFNWAKLVYQTKTQVLETTIDELRPWQKFIYTKTLQQNDRQITFCIDPVGAKGKTTLCKWIYQKHKGDVFICSGGKYQDILYAYQGESWVIMDLPRATESEHVSYRALEAFTNQLAFSGKYDSAMKIFNKPKIIVFSNSELDWGKLTHDRFDKTTFYLSSTMGGMNQTVDELIEQEQLMDDIQKYFDEEDSEEPGSKRQKNEHSEINKETPVSASTGNDETGQILHASHELSEQNERSTHRIVESDNVSQTERTLQQADWLWRS